MTKAATVGQARKRKRGRPRSEQPRYQSGRRMTPDEARRQAEAERDAMAPTLRRRCAAMGWVDDDQHMAAARDARLANPAGRLLLAGLITEDQYLALCDFREVQIRWAAAYGAPWPHPRGCAWAREAVSTPQEPAHGNLADFGMDDAERQKRASAALKSAELCLTASMVVAVNDLMADGRDDWSPIGQPQHVIQAARLASAALARHFGRRP